MFRPFAASSRPLDGSVWQLSTMPAAQVPGHAPRSFVPTMHSVVPSVPHQANSANIVFMQQAGHSQPPATQTMMPAFMSSAQSAVMEASKSVPIVPTQPAHSPQIRQGQFPQGMTAPAAGACVQAPGAMIPAAVQTQAPRSMVPHITPAAQTAPMHMHIRQVLAPGSQAIVQALQVVPQVRPGQTVQNNSVAMPAFQVPTQAPPFQNPFAWTSPPAGVMCYQAANGKPKAGQPKTVCTIVHPPRAQVSWLRDFVSHGTDAHGAEVLISNTLLINQSVNQSINQFDHLCIHMICISLYINLIRHRPGVMCKFDGAYIYHIRTVLYTHIYIL